MQSSENNHVDIGFERMEKLIDTIFDQLSEEITLLRHEFQHLQRQWLVCHKEPLLTTSFDEYHSATEEIVMEHEISTPTRRSKRLENSAIHDEPEPQDRHSFKCDHCHYSCARKSHLEIHGLIHTGERPFRCKQCHYATRWKGDIVKHKRKHHRSKPYQRAGQNGKWPCIIVMNDNTTPYVDNCVGTFIFSINIELFILRCLQFLD